MSVKNTVTLVGRLTKKPELRYSPNGNAVTSINLAVQRDFKNSNGDIECDFPNIVIWNKLAENAANHCLKGDLIGIQGRLQTRSYDDKDGKKVYVTEVICNSVDFFKLKSWENKSNSNQNHSNNYRNNNQIGNQRNEQDPFAGGENDFNDGAFLGIASN